MIGQIYQNITEIREIILGEIEPVISTSHKPMQPQERDPVIISNNLKVPFEDRVNRTHADFRKFAGGNDNFQFDQ